MKNKRNDPKDYANQAAFNRIQVSREINANKIELDQTVFQKTSEERVKLKAAKKEYKQSILA